MKTTARHFAIFKAECGRCIKRWKIVGQRVNYAHDKLDDARALFRGDAKNSVHVIVLSTHWTPEFPPTDKLVRLAARHECVHLLLARLDEAAQFRWQTFAQYTHATEAIVGHLLELLP